MHFQRLFSKITAFCQESFTYILAIYLILFLLENILPGFVSNTFDLNYILYLLIAVGVVSSFGDTPPVAEASAPSVWDYVLTVSLSLLGAVLIYLKTDLSFPLHLTVSILSGVLIFLTSLFTLVPDSLDLPKIKPPIVHLQKTFSYWPPVFGVVLIATVFLFFRFRQKQIIVPDSKISVQISNCSYNEELATTLAKTLIKKGYTQTTTGPADNHDCDGVVIYFAPADKDQADIITKSLEPLYPVIQKAPPMQLNPGKITIVLGNNYF